MSILEGTVCHCAFSKAPAAANFLAGSPAQAEAEPVVVNSRDQSSSGEGTSSSSSSDPQVSVPDIPGEAGDEEEADEFTCVRCMSESALRAEAASPAHKLAHYPHNPFCDICIRANMRQWRHAQCSCQASNMLLVCFGRASLVQTMVREDYFCQCTCYYQTA